MAMLNFNGSMFAVLREDLLALWMVSNIKVESGSINSDKHFYSQLISTKAYVVKIVLKIYKELWYWRLTDCLPISRI